MYTGILSHSFFVCLTSMSHSSLSDTFITLPFCASHEQYIYLKQAFIFLFSLSRTLAFVYIYSLYLHQKHFYFSLSHTHTHALSHFFSLPHTHTFSLLHKLIPTPPILNLYLIPTPSVCLSASRSILS